MYDLPVWLEPRSREVVLFMSVRGLRQNPDDFIVVFRDSQKRGARDHLKQSRIIGVYTNVTHKRKSARRNVLTASQSLLLSHVVHCRAMSWRERSCRLVKCKHADARHNATKLSNHERDECASPIRNKQTYDQIKLSALGRQFSDLCHSCGISASLCR